jgi:uncharacterized protein with NAD-binding domain and iron-sulfur cluster
MKKKIAVIGGGLGSLTAIYHLMSLPNAKDLYDITLYQDGWQLGGKGASGVNQKKGFRVEEHGIHFWFGFYENGFYLMKEVYKALNRPPEAPLATFEAAFKPQTTMDFAQLINDNWTSWDVEFPTLLGKVGDGVFESPIEELVEVGIRFLADEFHKFIEHLASGCLGVFLGPFQKNKKSPVHQTHEPYLNDIEEKLAKIISHHLERRLVAMAELYKNPETHKFEDRKVHGGYIYNLKMHIFDLVGHLLDKFPELLRIWCTIDLGLTILKGVIEDGVLQVKGRKFILDFSLINKYDFKEWLILHGADSHFIYNFPAVKSLYDGPFAFFRGAISTPDVEAGTALNILFRLAFTCKEAVMWRMQAGMGDTVFMPIYQYLQQNFPENVHFSFFHAATDLKLSKDKTKVEAIEFDRLIDLAENVATYQPAVTVKGLECWPSEPLYEQLNPIQVQKAQELKEKTGVGFESDWSGWKGTKVTKQIGRDFDEVIIGASLSALPNFCNDLFEHNPQWSKMLDKVGTVQTQAFQLWLTKDPQELATDPLKVLSTYVEPLDTMAAMTQILEREDWSGYPEQPKYLMYVCGAFIDSETIPDPPATYFAKNQLDEVFDNMAHYIENDLRFILPKAFDEAGNFDWNILFDPTGGVGKERLKYQYFRPNIDTTERYVYCLKDTSRFRLKTDESGFENVFLTGDWIQNGMNIGFVEGATISGILTARAVSGNENIPLHLPW